MPDLGCSVKSCTYNWDEKCDKDRILVEGSDACSCRETCCGSFKEAKDNSYKNVSKNVDMHVDVDCEAVDCVYNKEKRCAAEHIGIAGNNASTSKETECASFRAR